MKSARLLLLLLAACGVSPAPAIETPTREVVLGPSPDWKFEPASGSGPAIVLEPVVLEDTRAVFALRPRGLAPLHGVAFRLVFNPAEAELVGFQPSSDWASAPLVKIAEPRLGTVVAVMSRHGPTGAIVADELGRIELKLKATRSITLRLERTRAQGDHGSKIDAAWRAGALTR